MIINQSSFLKRRRPVAGRIGRALLAAALMVWLVSLTCVIVWGRRNEARPAAAIVVLGAAQYEGRPSPVLRARLDHAIQLWNHRMAPQLIFTGGTGMGDTTSEAAVGRRYAIQRGVPTSAVTIESRGLTTSQSLNAVAAIMRTKPERTVILVSDPFHMLRLSILSRRLGLVPLASPTRTSPISRSWRQQWKFVLSESVKVPLAFIFQQHPE